MDMSVAVDESMTPLVNSKYVTSPSDRVNDKPMRFDEGTVNSPELHTLKEGVMGKPSLATKEKGEKYCNIVIERMSELILDVLEEHPVGSEIVTTAYKQK
jgi:creatinine amidohydrolase/Fe(II)-dependent formamide hydrolase-like protein